MENAEHLHASSSMDAEKKQINKQIGQIYQNTCTDIGMKILSARFRNFATWFFWGHSLHFWGWEMAAVVTVFCLFK